MFVFLSHSVIPFALQDSPNRALGYEGCMRQQIQDVYAHLLELG